MYKCDICNKEFDTKKKLDGHQSVHSTKFINSVEKLKRPYIDKYEKNPKFCLYCDTKIPYEKRINKFCSRSCSSHFNNNRKGTGQDKNNCIVCNTETSNSKFCSFECKSMYESVKHKKYFEEWLMGDVKFKKRIIRNELIKFVGNKCEECGWNKIHPVTGNKPLQLHHIDGDCNNNQPSNLKILCPNCHSLTENYMSMNKNGQNISRRNWDRSKAKKSL